MGRFTVVLGVVGCAVLVSEALAATHKTGQYVVVLGEDGGGIAGSYWLAPDVKLSVRPHAQYGEISFFADRDFFPARVTEWALLLLQRYLYRPSPTPALAMADATIHVHRTTFGPIFDTTGAHGLVVGEKPIREDDIAVVPLGKATVKLGARDVEVLRYSITAAVLPDQENGPLGRVYFAAYDLDLDAQAAAMVRTAVEGDAASSADFLNEFFRTLKPAPALLSCLDLLRSTVGYAEANRRYRETVDAHTVESFPRRGRPSCWTRVSRP